MKDIRQVIEDLVEDIEECTLNEQVATLARYYDAIAQVGEYSDSAVVNACLTMVACNINRKHADIGDAKEEAARAAKHLKDMVERHHAEHRAFIDEEGED